MNALEVPGSRLIVAFSAPFSTMLAIPVVHWIVRSI
jgi:hypothetical protein